MSRLRRIPTVEELANHARQLAYAFRIEVAEYPRDFLPPEVAMSHAGHSIFIQEIYNHANYAIALHELGHCCAPSGFFTPQQLGVKEKTAKHRLIEEEAAWEWAQHHALDWTVEMQAVHDYAIETYHTGVRYEQLAQQQEDIRRRVAFEAKLPRSTETIQDFLRRIKK